MEQYLLMFCIAGIAGAAVYVFTRALIGETDEKLRQRLSNRGGQEGGATSSASPADAALPASPTGAVLPILQKIGQVAAEPFMPKTREKQSSLRRSLGQAGIYAPMAVTLVTGAKVIFLTLGLVGGYFLGAGFGNPWLFVSLGGLVGYCIPRFWLRMRMSRNQRELTIALPDALDLMVVCVEAGLTVDAAMQRVGQELGLAHPTLSRELGMTHMETRVGLSRADALKNLGLRTANPALQSLSSMLVQAERFGTSIAGALRIHAESLRVKRQHAAEELAAKASVKLSFPLVLFIFPATFIVLAGPTVIRMFASGFLD
jgi:tight adherence protein C